MSFLLFQPLWFLGGALDPNSVRKKMFSWIPDNSWLNLVALTELPAFMPLLDQLQMNESGWKAWYDSEQPENETIPDGYSDVECLFQDTRLPLLTC